MTAFADKFFRDLRSALDGIACSGKDGGQLPVGTGIEQCHAMMLGCAAKGGTIYMAGNGGSASIASHITVDLWKNGGVRAQAFNDSSLLTCLGNDLGYEQVFAAPIEKFADKGDVVVLISSSGQSPNMLAAAGAALKRGCRLITLTGFKPGNPLRSMGEINFHVPSGEYGFVETAHAAICHAFVDGIILEKNKR
ncbi:MAG: SIS domain-containing protein [Elusimicrobia bacterium]|nr:SIS domain-containing protein [Elusimicrobiota bacterium]